MATASTTSTLDGFFKEVYEPILHRLHPESAIWQKRIKFARRDEMPGKFYNFPVRLRREHGITYAPPNAGLVTLKPAKAQETFNAQVKGSQIAIRSAITEEAAHSAEKGKRAFGETTAFVVEGLVEDCRHRIEIDLRYGQSGIATVSGVSSLVISLNATEWAPHIWVGQENVEVEFFDSTLATQRGGAGVYATVTAVNMEDKKITVDAVPSGVTSTDIVFFRGQYSVLGGHSSCVGAHKILTTTSGSLFGISLANSMWKANQYDVGTALFSFPKFQAGVAQAAGKGLKADTLLLVSLATWGTFMGDQAALRRYDSSQNSNRYELGSEGLVFHTQVGRTEVLPDGITKESYAYLVNPSDWRRPGATDFTMRHADTSRGEYFRLLTDELGYELRGYSNQSTVCVMPGRQLAFTGIDNTV